MVLDKNYILRLFNLVIEGMLLWPILGIRGTVIWVITPSFEDELRLIDYLSRLLLISAVNTMRAICDGAILLLSLLVDNLLSIELIIHLTQCLLISTPKINSIVKE